MREEYINEDEFIQKIKSQRNKNTENLKMERLQKYKARKSKKCDDLLEASPIVIKILVSCERVFLK